MNLPMVDKNKVGVMGGSQGGGLSLAGASLVPEIRKIATDNPFLCDYKRVWQMDLTFAAYSELRLYFRDFDPLYRRDTKHAEILEKWGVEIIEGHMIPDHIHLLLSIPPK